jgi:ABC-type transporter Mla maintaining outer membrane lipid asymmetry ATPase subunit MlaF
MSAPLPVELAGVDVSPPTAPAHVVLDAVDWRIGEGEIHAVAGEQGSGRSALLSTAAGLHPAAAGTVRLFGRDLGSVTEAEHAALRRRIGFVFEQGGRLLSHLTVVENVALPLQYVLGLDAADARVRAGALLEAHGLAGVADAAPSGLGVRVQQRASLVRALAVPRDLLFLDNPLSGTTARGSDWWLDAVRRARAERPAGAPPLTVVATCDDFGPWTSMATHFALIEHRRLRPIGGPEALAEGGDAALRDFLSSPRWPSRT